MNQGSRFYDLRTRGNVWSSPRLELPERLTTPNGEALERINLPNASLCADFIVAPKNVWAGVAVAVSASDIPVVSKMFEKCSTALVRLIQADDAKRIERYISYPDLSWIEVLWFTSSELQLVEVQTNEVLWYALRRRTGDDPKIVLLALENLPSLVNESEEPLIVP